MAGEQVLGFSRRLLAGRIGDSEAVWNPTLLSSVLSHSHLRPRVAAEDDPSWKQIVVYTVLFEDEMVLTYRRTAHGGETSLHGARSIGIGGHVNRTDFLGSSYPTQEARVWHAIEQAVRREVSEELRGDHGLRGQPSLVCVLNDDTESVGEVHFGLIWAWRAEFSEIEPRPSAGVTDLRGEEVRSILDNQERYENWSRILCRHFALYGAPPFSKLPGGDASSPG